MAANNATPTTKYKGRRRLQLFLIIVSCRTGERFKEHGYVANAFLERGRRESFWGGEVGGRERADRPPKQRHEERVSHQRNPSHARPWSVPHRRRRCTGAD